MSCPQADIAIRLLCSVAVLEDEIHDLFGIFQAVLVSVMSFPKFFATSILLSATAFAAKPEPAEKDFKYGTHERQALDFYKAVSDKPTPLIVHIHGGGWINGDKHKVPGLDQYLKAGISVASINYRYTWQAQQDGIEPPVKAPFEDAARAIQTLRSKAAEWNIDKTKVAATGRSAGACTSLWLAMHDDLADPESTDPIARESSRLSCAAVDVAQTSLDPKQLREWTPNSRYGGHAFGITDISKPHDTKGRDSKFQEFHDNRERLLPWIKEYSPIEQASSDDPPIYLFYASRPSVGKKQGDPTHTANYGVKLEERLKSLGVPCELVYPGAPDVTHSRIENYLIDRLTK